MPILSASRANLEVRVRVELTFTGLQSVFFPEDRTNIGARGEARTLIAWVETRNSTIELYAQKDPIE